MFKVGIVVSYKGEIIVVRRRERERRKGLLFGNERFDGETRPFPGIGSNQKPKKVEKENKMTFSEQETTSRRSSEWSRSTVKTES